MSELKSRIRRVQEFADSKRGKRLKVLFRCPDGTETTGSVDDLIESQGEFLRVLSGNSLEDVDTLLKYEVPDCVIE